MTNREDSIVAARDMYCKCLQDSMSPFIIFLFREMFGKMPKSKRTLKNLQMQLREVKTWNGHQVKEVVDDIVKSQSRTYYEDLLTAILVSNAEILSTISVVKNPSKINLKIPKLENYIHECIINVARALYKNAFLFDENVSSLQRQRHNNEFDLLVRDAIQSSIQQILPIQDIIKQYIMGESTAADEGHDLFLPDDDIPSPVQAPPLDTTLQEYMRHGNDEEVAPETIQIVEPEDLLEEAMKQSKDPVIFLDENEIVTEPKEDSQEQQEDRSELDVPEKDHDVAEVDKIEEELPATEERPPVDENDRVKKDMEGKRAQGFSLVKRSGSGLFVEDENEDDDEDKVSEGHLIKAIEPRNSESRLYDKTSDPEKVKGARSEGRIEESSPKNISKQEKLSRMMLPRIEIEKRKPEPVSLVPLSESDDDDLSLYGLSDENTNWSDDDNEFAYTDDELLTSDGEEDKNDDEDIDTMINRIRTASKDTDSSKVKIISPKKIVEKFPAPISDVSNSLDIEIDLPTSDNDDGDEIEDNESAGEDLPFQDVKTIHIEDSRPLPKKARKSRKSRKTKTPVILFPDAASENECV